MASRKPVLIVQYSPRAERQLEEIYTYNLDTRGLAAADRYISFLKSKIAHLSTDYANGRPILTRPNLRYVLMKLRSGKWTDGHVVVYQVVEATKTVDIWFIFHTKQDWESRLE